jgi:predicted patatin/cPLA2 family phospholipase
VKNIHEFKLIGASAGALTSSLVATNVNFDQCLELAYHYSEHHQVRKNPFGLAVIWGDLLRRWLDELLPSNIEPSHLKNIYLLVTISNSFQPQLISQIQSKQELIDACLTSAHLPFFMNGKFSTKFKDQYYIDGSIRSYITRHIPLPPELDSYYKIDFRRDPLYSSTKLPGKLVSYERASDMMRSGYSFMQREHESGNLPEEFTFY